MSLEAASFRNYEADIALCEHYGKSSIERSIVDGQRGYRVTLPNGVRCFHFKLGSALRQMLEMLGHAEDRDLILMGDENPNGGNVW